MALQNLAFDDFLDSCFIAEDPLCKSTLEQKSDLLSEKILTELIKTERDLELL